MCQSKLWILELFLSITQIDFAFYFTEILQKSNRYQKKYGWDYSLLLHFLKKLGRRNQ